MKKLLSLLMATVFALSLSFVTFAEDKPAAEKSTASTEKKKKSKKTKKEAHEHTDAHAADKKAK